MADNANLVRAHNELIDRVASSGRAELVASICAPFPISVTCELLGAPKDDWQQLGSWAEDVLRLFNRTINEELDLIMRAQDQLYDYTRRLIGERRTRPANDLITALISAEEAGDRMSNDDLVMMVGTVFAAGTDTTRNQLGCSLALFAEHPDQWKLLADHPELALRAVDETMRYCGAVRGVARIAPRIEVATWQELALEGRSCYVRAAERTGPGSDDIQRFEHRGLEAHGVVELRQRTAAPALLDHRRVAIDAEHLDRVRPHVLRAPRDQERQVRAAAARIEQVNHRMLRE